MGQIDIIVDITGNGIFGLHPGQNLLGFGSLSAAEQDRGQLCFGRWESGALRYRVPIQTQIVLPDPCPMHRRAEKNHQQHHHGHVPAAV